MIAYRHFKDRDAWLKGREKYNGIGASEAAAIVGATSWMTATELWQIKTGQKKPKDLSDNEYVRYGQSAEEHVRQLFMLKHEELKLTYRPYDFVFQKERPWLRATLDGELEDEEGAKGILEIKTSFIKSKNDLAKWNGRIPDQYLVQIAHQFLATDFDFAYLTAELIFQNFDSQIRTYYFLKEDLSEDMDWLLHEEEQFWKSVESGNSPNVKLTL